MAKDLTSSDIHRRNILNNKYAIEEIENEIGFIGIPFEDSLKYTKKQISEYFDVNFRTIERYLDNHENEFVENGYEVLSGKRLKDFKNAFEEYVDSKGDFNEIDTPNIDDVTDIDVGDITKAPKLGVFTFRAFLNIGMLLTESERAKQLRALILDIVIDTLNKKLGGNVKYINQKESEFLPAAIREFNYRKEFTNAIDLYVSGNNWKYGQLTDAVYKCVFHENAKEYKKILKLKAKDSARSTMYSEVLDLIAAYENGFAEYLKEKFLERGSQFTLHESLGLFKKFESANQAFTKPLLEKARTLMASRDMAFRDALHEKLKSYITHLNAEEFEKFLAEKNIALEEHLKENIDVFKRLKER